MFLRTSYHHISISVPISGSAFGCLCEEWPFNIFTFVHFKFICNHFYSSSCRKMRMKFATLVCSLEIMKGNWNFFMRKRGTVSNPLRNCKVVNWSHCLSVALTSQVDIEVWKSAPYLLYPYLMTRRQRFFIFFFFNHLNNTSFIGCDLCSVKFLFTSE